jgi:hypothetical protein
VANLWPWLAVAGVGAFHGLNPATGWIFAAAWGLKSNDRRQALRALLPIAVGHTASIALVAGAVALGLASGTLLLQVMAGVLLVVVAIVHVTRRASRTRHVGLALWSFIMCTAQGAGLMLVPALVPLCLSDTPAKEITATGSLALAFAAVAVHTASMLAVTTALSLTACSLPRTKQRGRVRAEQSLLRLNRARRGGAR